MKVNVMRRVEVERREQEQEKIKRIKMWESKKMELEQLRWKGFLL